MALDIAIRSDIHLAARIAILVIDFRQVNRWLGGEGLFTELYLVKAIVLFEVTK